MLNLYLSVGAGVERKRNKRFGLFCVIYLTIHQCLIAFSHVSVHYQHVFSHHLLI